MEGNAHGRANDLFPHTSPVAQGRQDGHRAVGHRDSPRCAGPPPAVGVQTWVSKQPGSRRLRPLEGGDASMRREWKAGDAFLLQGISPVLATPLSSTVLVSIGRTSGEFLRVKTHGGAVDRSGAALPRQASAAQRRWPPDTAGSRPGARRTDRQWTPRRGGRGPRRARPEAAARHPDPARQPSRLPQGPRSPRLSACAHRAQDRGRRGRALARASAIGLRQVLPERTKKITEARWGVRALRD